MLAGLSAAQHWSQHTSAHDATGAQEKKTEREGEKKEEEQEEEQEEKKEETEGEDALGSAFRWTHVERGRGSNNSSSAAASSDEVFDNLVQEPADVVQPIHPVFVIPYASVAETRARFGSKVGF